MPSPAQSSSNASPNQRASTGDAIRRGEIKISDPIPFTYHLHSAMDQEQERFDLTWPRKSAPSALQIRRESSSEGIANARASAGPSIVASTMSSQPKNYPSEKKGGFRATIKRMFSNKRQSSNINSRNQYHQSEPGNLSREQEHPPASSTPRKLSVPHLSSRTQESAIPDLPSPHSILMSHRRRNTLPSIILSDEEAQALAARCSPRSGKPTDKPDTNQLKRRSRSADALTDMTYPSDTSPDRQDRKGEIAFWRNSILLDPIPALTPSDSTTRPSVRKEPPRQQPVFDNFDFGLDNQPTTLDQRVDTLEVKVFDFEYALAKLQGIDIPKPILPLRTKKRRSVHEIFPTDSFPSSMTSSATNETTFLSSPGHSPITPLDDENLRADRGSKATTIKPERRKGSDESHSATLPSIPSSQFETLLGLIRDERAARQQMEMQIMDLQKELEYLRTPIYASIQPSKYPAGGPESPRTKPLHRSPRFEFQKLPAQETSRFSMTESEMETDTEEGFQEVFQTPQENQFAFETSRAKPLVGMI